jgi:predicted AAA+ superfamily ATPase
MQIKSVENIIKVLSAFNPWWKLGSVTKDFAKPFKRFAYYEALKILTHPDIRRMVIISGARRTGKTTVLYQMIDNFLKHNVNPKQIIYISFDHPVLKLCSVDEILDIFHSNVYGDKDAYYFFDEIQYADRWDNWLKTIYDTQPLTKVVATGSASPVLINKASESGVGRWTVLSVPTLSFYEYCHLIGANDLPELDKRIKPSDLIYLSKQEQTGIFLKLSVLQKHFLRYLQVGGFPELALSKDEFYAQRMLREDVVDKVLKRDIPAIYSIRSISDLEKIFLYLCYHSSNIISIDAIAKELNGVSRPTVEKYINYLESANLIYVSEPVELKGKKVLKVQPKIYIADAAIRNAIIMQDDVLTDPEEMGIMVETAVYKHIRAFYYQNSLTTVGYHRISGSKTKEIDVVVNFPRGKIFVEVKYRENYNMGSSEAIVVLSEEAQSCLLITKRDDDYGPLQTQPDRIYRIPAFAFLYLLGHAEKNSYHFEDSF